MVERQSRDLEVLGSNLGPGSNFSFELNLISIKYLNGSISHLLQIQKRKNRKGCQCHLAAKLFLVLAMLSNHSKIVPLVGLGTICTECRT